MPSQTAGLIPDFEDILEQAECNASTDWEMSFVSDMKYRYSQYGSVTYVSDRQFDQLKRIAGM